MRLLILATVLLHYCSVNGLQSSGDEFYIPFWFDDPRNSSDTTLLYLSTFGSAVIKVNVSIHIQNHTRVSVFSQQILVSPNNISVVDVEKWLPPDIGTAQDRAPEPSWWLIDYLHIKTEGGNITIHVHSRIDDKLYTYNPFPLHRYNRDNGNFTHYILQEPQPDELDSELPVTVVLAVCSNTVIYIGLQMDSYLQLSLINNDDDIQKHIIRRPGDGILYRIPFASTRWPHVLVITPIGGGKVNSDKKHNAIKLEANDSFLVFTGKGLKQRNNGFLPHQQIPPTIDWGRNFIAFPIPNKGWDINYFLQLVTGGPVQHTVYEPYTPKDVKNNNSNVDKRTLSDFEPGYIIDDLNSFNHFWYYSIQGDIGMWATQGYSGKNSHLFSAIPAVEHYANCYKFPAAGNTTFISSVEVKLVIPTEYFQPEKIILDGVSLQDRGINFQQLYTNHTVAYHLAQYQLEGTDLNIHQMHHENSSAKFGLLILAGFSYPPFHARPGKVAFPAGFAGDPSYYEDSSRANDNTKQNNLKSKISPAIVVAVVLGIVAVMIACIFVVRSGVKKRRKMKGFAHHRLSMPMFEMREPDSANCEYDLFISFAEEDHNFVEEQLFHPLEEKGFQVCWHHRDFLPGYSIIENIKNSMDRSRRVILVFSEHFHKSEYCMFELRYSCDKMLATNSQMLIPIVLHEDSFPRELDHITYWCFSAEHPEENNFQALSESLGTPIARESQEALDLAQEAQDQEEEALFQEDNVLYML